MGENTFLFCFYTDINPIVDSYVPNIERIWNKSDSFDCFCGTIQIIFFLQTRAKTVSRQYAERTKQMEQILNFQVPSEGLELVILLHKYTVLSFEASQTNNDSHPIFFVLYQPYMPIIFY